MATMETILEVHQNKKLKKDGHVARELKIW